MRIERRSVPRSPLLDFPGLHPVLRRVYAARGVQSPDELDLRLTGLLAPQLAGLEAAVDLLISARASDQSVLVVGDFDADGATGSAVAVRGLRLLGFRRVGYRVPNRFLHGYGLSPALVAELEPAPDLILTVDNGVAAHAGIAAAHARGVRVIVTDHHLPGDSLPPADALVNPNVPGCEFPSKALAGVGVVFYLLLALRARLREGLAFAGGEPDLAQLLDLVALGTVADLVPLDRNNRLLVQAGLKRIRAGRACAGVRALYRVAGRDPSRASATDFGFVLGPRINAAGRLEDMAVGIECLLSDDETTAFALAQRLHALNAERRELQQQMVEQAEAAVLRADFSAQAHVSAGVALADAGWHAGVVGLVASKLKERLHRPVFALAPGDEEGREWKGSGRSIAGFHLRDCLAEIDAQHPGLMLRFGGHAMAAGLSLADVEVERFCRVFAATVERRIDPALLAPVLLTDGELAAGEFELGLAETLREAGPFGQAFPEPVFDGVFEVLDWRLMGERHLRFSLRHPDSRIPLSAVYFGGWTGSPPPRQVHLAYQLGSDDYRGAPELRLYVRHLLPA
ncbi:MAG: single-stranded-DNA-specific exonuclease RecJ [Xanthomonadales bacterium]|nr:single-stranded-DNA-specific exonuclease RecJ [Xanthomonadales bacterium]